MGLLEEIEPSTVVGTNFQPIIENQASQDQLPGLKFDPMRHLTYEGPEGMIMMEDIGFSRDTGVSPVAVSQPFPLFTDEAVQKMRNEVLSVDVFSNCQYKSNIAACQLRGYARRFAPFVHEAWHHPETLRIISDVAGVELVPQMDFEIGHINISVKSKQQASAERELAQRKALDDEDSPVVGWHNDSYPFVCVVMLSDCTNMVGGETAMRTAEGEIMKVRGPQMGCAVVMQGRYITHQALRALGTQERITMVTSFRPKSPHLPDNSDLHTVRGISDLSELYCEYGSYRLQIVAERITDQLRRLNEARMTSKRTDTRSLKAFLEGQIRFLTQTNSEIVQDEDVIFGVQPEINLPDCQVVSQNAESGGVEIAKDEPLRDPRRNTSNLKV